MINQSGATDNTDIVGEASLDVEWAHAIAPGASIIVYNADNNAGNSIAILVDAMNTVSLMTGVSVVTLSYGEPEYGLTDETVARFGFHDAGRYVSRRVGRYRSLQRWPGVRQLPGGLAQRRFRWRHIDRDRF